jgi:predicted nucleic acid-binding Zn ribbon protein
VLGSPQPVCAVCGGHRDRKREACSDRCRAALSRRRRVQAQASRDDELRATLTEIRELV